MFAGLRAQSVQETTIQFGDYTIPAFELTLQQGADLVTNALNQRLKDASVKPGKSSGFIAVQEQTFAEIYSQPVDFYAKVEERGKKKDRVTVVTFFAKSPNLTISQNELNMNVRRFAEGFPNYVTKYEAQQNLNAGEKNLKAAQKKQEKAVAAAASLEKDIASDQKKIEKKEAEKVKLQKKMADIDKEIEKLNAKIEKNREKQAGAQEKVREANEAVQSSEDDVNRYRQQAE